MNNVYWILLAFGSIQFTICAELLEVGLESVGEEVADNGQLLFAHVVSGI